MYSMYCMLIPCPHRLLHIKYQYKTSFPKAKMMFPWARQKSSVTPITGMILPFVWPFLGLGHVAYYPLPWLVRIVPSFPDRPWSQSSSSEYNGSLHTVNLTADVNSNLPEIFQDNLALNVASLSAMKW